MVEKIILEVLSGERVAVRVFESDDPFLLLLLVRGGCCSGHRWSGGGVDEGRCRGQLSDMSESRTGVIDRHCHFDHFIILVTTSSSSIYLPPPPLKSNPPPFSFAPAALPFSSPSPHLSTSLLFSHSFQLSLSLSRSIRSQFTQAFRFNWSTVSFSLSVDGSYTFSGFRVNTIISCPSL